MNFSKVTYIGIFSFLVQFAFSQERDLLFYQTKAHENNPVLKENVSLQQINELQLELTQAQIQRPKVFLTSDYLFAPFFFDNDQFISITTNPEENAYGYDVGLTNGGLYSAQLNAAVPLFKRSIVNAYGQQVATQNQALQNNNSLLLHELDKMVTDQYIAIYQWQQQIVYQHGIINKLDERKAIIGALVQKGLLQQNEYLLLEIEVKKRQYDTQQLEINLSEAFNQLNSTCGISDTTKFQLPIPVIQQSPPVKQYFYLRKYEIDSAAISIQEQVFNTKYKPQLDAYGNTGINASDASRIPHNVGISAGLHLEIPLYDGGQKKTIVQQNRILLENLNLYQTQNSVFIQNSLASTQEQIDLTQKSIAMIDSQLSSQELLLGIIKDKVVTGQISVTDFLLAIQEYSTSNQNRIQAQTNLWLLINQYNGYNW